MFHDNLSSTFFFLIFIETFAMSSGYWLGNHRVARHVRISTEFMKKLIANRKVTNVNMVCTRVCTWGRLSLVEVYIQL
jgi:hypothetical protein